AALLELLPLDEPRRAGALVRRALAASDRGPGADPSLDAGSAPDRIVRVRVVAARHAGELRPDVDVDLESGNLMHILTGLADRLIAGRTSPSQASVAITYALGRLFQQPGPGVRARPGPDREPVDAPTDSVLRLLRVAER